MLLAYQFKLQPNKTQIAAMERCLHLLRLQYNFRLLERIEAYEQVIQPKLGEYFDLKSQAVIYPLTCSISKSALYGEAWKINKKGEIKRKSAYEMQSSDLPNLKKERPWYKDIPSQPLQQTLMQLDEAFQRFFKGLSGYPKFKRRGKFRSFTYPAGACEFQGNKIRLPGFGWMRFHQSRQFPDGFKPKKVTVRKKADGWYISVCLEDATVPATPQPNDVKTAVGVNKLVSLSNGETIANPKFYAKQEKKRKRLNRAASRKRKGSNTARKVYERLARVEQKITNQRNDYQWKIAHRLTKKYDLIVFEDLNVQGMIKRCKPKWSEEEKRYLENGQSRKVGLNKAIADASWYSLKQKTKILAERHGVLVQEINPRHSSQECSQCSFVSPTNRDKEKFVCESCGYHADADVQAAVNILNRGLEQLGNKPKIRRVTPEFTPKKLVERQGKSAVQPVESGNKSNKPVDSIQLSLFDLMGFCPESPSKSVI
ncbi:MAG TPA: transposase [Oculatellaceae cyanobacterium]|jgi:putative transposase